MQASYLLKSENHRDSSFSFIQGIDKIEKQRLYFLLLYHKRLLEKRLPILLSLFQSKLACWPLTMVGKDS